MHTHTVHISCASSVLAFLGEYPHQARNKDKVLQAFGAHIFFDDQEAHLKDAALLVPSARVPYLSNSPLSIKKQTL